MASSSLLLSPLSSATTVESRELSRNSSGSAFFHNPKLLFGAKPRKRQFRSFGFKSPVAQKSLDHIPKQFREENLKDGLMDNFKNAHKFLYGLTPKQMGMFMTEDSLVRRQSEKVTEETISSAYNYLNNGGMWSMSGMNEKKPSRYSMSMSMYSGGGYRRPKSSPPDLPSLLLDARIVFLGMPLVPAVAELLVAQFMWLDFDSSTKPIYLYINSTGTQNEKRETVGSENEAYLIADCMAFCKAKVYTINCGMAFGQAAMLLSIGAKGYRGLLPNSCTKLYLPNVNKSSGSVSDMWLKAKELDVSTDKYLDFLAKGIGKPKEEIEKDIQRPKFLLAQDAINYGVADKIVDSQDPSFEKRNYEELLAQSKAMRQSGSPGVNLGVFK